MTTKLNHSRFGTCWLESLDTKTYSLPFATVYSDKLGETIVRSLCEFELFPKEIYHCDDIVYRYLKS